MKIGADAFPLTDASKCTCALGGKDCIEFLTSGQIPIPGQMAVSETSGQLQNELNPMGKPETLNEHPITLELSIMDQNQKILVTAVKGPVEAFAGQSAKYEVERYNVRDVSEEVRSQVKWKITVDDREIAITQPHKDVLELPVKSEWQGKQIVAKAYIKTPSEKVCRKTQVKQWEFPIIIDLYKMPGLNENCDDIAEDMGYGFGRKCTPPIYTQAEIAAYTNLYRNKSDEFDKELKQSIFSNAVNLPQPDRVEEEPQNDRRDEDTRHDPVFVQDNTRIVKPDPEIAQKILARRGKAVYDKKEISFLLNGLINFMGFGIWKMISDSILSNYFPETYDKQLFNTFRNMATILVSFNDPMKQNIEAMIDKFQRNEGGVYENPVLTQEVEKHPSTLRYCTQLEEYIREKLTEYQGDIGRLHDTKVYDKGSQGDRRGLKSFSLTPQYDGGIIKAEKRGNLLLNGLAIALGDIWAAQVLVPEYKLYEDGRYSLEYRVTLWDHFGLNYGDLKISRELIDGFVAWFILQHFRGYKPFITKITFTKTMFGKL